MNLNIEINGPILVTGASGFVGSHVVKRLLSLGKDVHAMVRASSNLARLKGVEGKLTIHYGNLDDKTSIEKILTEVKPKGVFHFGAAIVVSGVGASSDTMFSTNLLGIVNLLSVLEKIEYDFFVTTGSFLEYGFKDHPIVESELCEPGEVYGLSKLAGSLYAQINAKNKQKPIVVFRLFTPYGPNNEPARLTHKIVRCALEGTEIALTSPTVSRDFVYIDDVVSLLIEGAIKAKEYAGQIFNLGSGVNTPIGEVVDYIVDKTKSKAKVKWGSFRSVSYDSDMWQANMKKTFSHFSWRPSTLLKEGLDKTITHFKEYGC